MTETTTGPDLTQDEIDAIRAYESAIRDSVRPLIEQALDYFTGTLDYTVEQALEEIAVQALTRATLLFGMLPAETQQAIADAPLISAPQV